MNETPKKEPAMEGREHDPNGKDIGDARFHNVGWNTTPEAAQEDVERIAASEVELAERQAASFADRDPEMGIKAYEGLIVLYPDHPAVPQWKERIEQLRSTK